MRDFEREIAPALHFTKEENSVHYKLETFEDCAKSFGIKTAKALQDAINISCVKNKPDIVDGFTLFESRGTEVYISSTEWAEDGIEVEITTEDPMITDYPRFPTTAKILFDGWQIANCRR